jgi:uncharacterized membrane protein
MKNIEWIVIVVLMALPFFLIRGTDFTTYIYWTVVTFGYLIYIAYSTRMWTNE